MLLKNGKARVSKIAVDCSYRVVDVKLAQLLAMYGKASNVVNTERERLLSAHAQQMDRLQLGRHLEELAERVVPAHLE